ncbi:WD40 repeat protein, partial [Spraguea lophii 42_110]
MFTIPLPRVKSLLMHKNDILCTLYTGEVYVYSINSINNYKNNDILDSNNNKYTNTNNNINNTNNTIQPHTKLSLLDLPIRTSTIANNLILLGADNGRIYILSNEYKKVGELNVHTDIIRRVIYNNNMIGNSNNNMMIGNNDTNNTYNNNNTNTSNSNINKNNISVASCSDDTTIKLYALENNHLSLISTLTGHNHYVMDISFINNNTLASCSIDTTIKIWNISTNTTISTLKGHIDCINSILYTNNRIYTAGDDHRINVYDYKKAKIISSYENISSYDIYKLYTVGINSNSDISNNMSNNMNNYTTTNIPNNHINNTNNIYIGTENSLMVYKDNKIYTLISNTTRVWDILIYNRYLFLATDEGIKIQKNKENRIIAMHKNKIYYNIDDTFITYKIKISDIGIDGNAGVIDSNKGNKNIDRIGDNNTTNLTDPIANNITNNNNNTTNNITNNNNIPTTKINNNIINIMKREIDINNINITNI